HTRALWLPRRGRFPDLLACLRLADQSRGEHALALDFDHAGATIAVGPVAGLRRITQMRDVDAATLRDLPDRLAVARDDFLSVEREADAGRLALLDAALAAALVAAVAERRLRPLLLAGSVALAHRFISTRSRRSGRAQAREPESMNTASSIEGHGSRLALASLAWPGRHL